MPMRKASVKLAAASLGAMALSAFMAFGAIGATAPATPSQALVNDAFKAMGMGEQYLGEGTRPPDRLVTLTARGTVQAGDPGESEPWSDLTKPEIGTASFVHRWHHSQALSRTELVRPR